jgi:hypothetical protein
MIYRKADERIKILLRLCGMGMARRRASCAVITDLES